MKKQQPNNQGKQQQPSSKPAMTGKDTSLHVQGTTVNKSHTGGPKDQPSLVSKAKLLLFSSDGRKKKSSKK